MNEWSFANGGNQSLQLWVWEEKLRCWIQDGGIQDGCHHQVESEWMSEGFFVQMVGTNLGKCEWVWEEKLRWLNPRWQYSRWQNSRWLPSSSWVRMNKFESDWISLSQESEWRESVFEWIWEKKTRCLNPNQNSRWLPSSSWVRMNEWSFLIQHGRIQDGCHHQVESEWMSEGFFVQMVGTNLGKCEWVWEEKLRWLNPRWPNSRRIQDGCHHQVEWEWISLSQIELVLSQSLWVQQCLNPRGQNSRWLPSSS